MENTLIKVRNKIEAIRELFGDKEVTLPVTFKIVNGKVTADIGQFTVNDVKAVRDIETKDVKTASKSPLKEKVCTLGKWANKLPEKFITLAGCYEGICRFTYHTIYNEDGIIRVRWKNIDGTVEDKVPYISSRECAHKSMEYLMLVCNEGSTADRWRDFDVLKIAPGNWNSVVKETLVSDPLTAGATLTAVVYDIFEKEIKLVHFNEREVDEINDDIAADDVRKLRNLGAE